MNEATKEKFNTLFEQLVPGYGKADTLAGELLRAAAKLRHDFYNNGMGNNTSGAIHFLAENSVLDANGNTFRTIYEYTRGRIYNGRYNNDSLNTAIDTMVETTLEFVTRNPQTMTIANTVDMYDMEEDMIDFCEECEVELDGWNESGCGHICQDCVDQLNEEEEMYC